MKETCYRVKMTACRVKIKGFGRVEKKVLKGGKKGILRVKKTLFEGEKKGSPWEICVCGVGSSQGSAANKCLEAGVSLLKVEFCGRMGEVALQWRGAQRPPPNNAQTV